MEHIRLAKTVQVGNKPSNIQRKGTVLDVVDAPQAPNEITLADAKAFTANGYAKEYKPTPATKDKGAASENKDKGAAPENKGKTTK